MKRFFIIFFIFLCSPLAKAEDLSWYKTPEFQKRAIEFVQYMDTLTQQNQNDIKNKNVGSILEDPTAYNVLSPAYLTQTDTSPLSGIRGYGEFTELPFGKARLISCYSGIRGNPAVFAALQVYINRQWYIHKPFIEITTSKAYDPIISAPLNNNLKDGQTKTDTYYGYMIFPIIMGVTNLNEPFDLKTHIKINACTKTGCEIFDIPLSLTLTNTERFATGICPLMIQILQQTPMPPTDGTTVETIQNKDGDVQFYFTLAKDTKALSIQIDNDWTFEEISKSIKGNVASIIIRPSVQLSKDDTIHLKAITSIHSYDLPTTATQGTFLKIIYPFAWGGAFLGGIFLFFFTPFFALFMLQNPRTKKAVKEKGKEISLTILGFTFLFALTWQSGLFMPYSILQSYPILGWFALALLLYLLWRPHKNLLASALLLLILPKSYLDAVFATTPPDSLYPFFTALYWGICVSLPFYFMYKKPDTLFKILKIFKSTPKQTLKFIRIPIAILILWLTIGGGVNYYVNKDIQLFSPEKLQSALNENKIVFVSAENPICLQCVWNKAVAMRTGFARNLYKSQRLIVLRMENTSANMVEFKSKYDKNFLPINVLYGPGNKDGLVLSDYISYTNLQKYLLAVLKIE